MKWPLHVDATMWATKMRLQLGLSLDGLEFEFEFPLKTPAAPNYMAIPGKNVLVRKQEPHSLPAAAFLLEN